jgi:hypothetical protein
MDIYEEDILALFSALEEDAVRYILIGGFATNYHGFSRATGGLDLWVEETPENKQRLISALRSIGMEGVEALANIPFIAGYCQIMLDNGFIVDLIGNVKGLDVTGFDVCYQQAERVSIAGTTIPFLHFNHLIKSKIAADRPKDRLDIEELSKLKKYRSQNDTTE